MLAYQSLTPSKTTPSEISGGDCPTGRKGEARRRQPNSMPWKPGGSRTTRGSLPWQAGAPGRVVFSVVLVVLRTYGIAVPSLVTGMVKLDHAAVYYSRSPGRVLQEPGSSIRFHWHLEVGALRRLLGPPCRMLDAGVSTAERWQDRLCLLTHRRR